MKTRKLACFVACLAVVSMAADWPQWRGPNRDGLSQERGLLKSWPARGPKLLWTFRDAGVGYSCPAIIGDRLYTMGGRKGDEYLFALDIKDPKAIKEAWAVKMGPVFSTETMKAWGVGPRATPTVDGDLIYALGSQGQLICVEAKAGKEKWRQSMTKDLGGAVNPITGGPGGWGWTWSPFVDGDQLICLPGGKQGTFAALNKESGKVMWRSKDLTEQCTYSSPIAAEVGGVRQYIVATNKLVAGVSAKDGSVLWTYAKKPPFPDVFIPTPLFHDGHIYVTGWGGGCALIKLTAANGKINVAEAYRNKVMSNRIGGVVLVGDSVYGFAEGKGWICQEFKTGKLRWNKKNVLSDGSLIAADGRLYCYGEDDGILAMIEASTSGWKETGRLEIPEKTKIVDSRPSGKVWTPPVIANGRLYLRDQDLIFCYQIK
jgi:outer membrane protein assembly factor BamB